MVSSQKNGPLPAPAVGVRRSVRTAANRQPPDANTPTAQSETESNGESAVAAVSVLLDKRGPPRGAPKPRKTHKKATTSTRSALGTTQDCNAYHEELGREFDESLADISRDHATSGKLVWLYSKALIYICYSWTDLLCYIDVAPSDFPDEPMSTVLQSHPGLSADEQNADYADRMAAQHQQLYQAVIRARSQSQPATPSDIGQLGTASNPPAICYDDSFKPTKTPKQTIRIDEDKRFREEY
ncbi:hypothetical protein BJ138DRAFT_1106706 [Hygrophoropsis aurantiaca]|uniref:Uncharacterized protein n=1 Tax=Hygrophoropsis aurantiaca TaxID=72124 RepID=A0ACB7ZU20_9AGAM|nr:hypothetical protein BJ138DRAFT_1106706 [Hygrophoropsis aurantiaca]